MADEASRAEAGELALRAHVAAEAWARASQDEVDRVATAMARAAAADAERLAVLAGRGHRLRPRGPQDLQEPVRRRVLCSSASATCRRSA